MVINFVGQCFKQTINALIIKLSRNRWIYRHCFGIEIPSATIPLHLLTNVSQRVQRSFLLELVEHHNFSQIQHINFLELRGRTVFTRHHIHGNIRNIYDFGITLTNTAGFYNHQIKTRCFAYFNSAFDCHAGSSITGSRSQAPHKYAIRIQAIHANAVAQQRPTSAHLRGINRNNGNINVVKLRQESPDELIGQRALPCPTSPGNPNKRDGMAVFLGRNHVAASVK